MSEETKRQHLFISHYHKDDAELDKFTELMGKRGYDVRNSSIRLKPKNERRIEEKRVPEEVIRRLLSIKISWASIVMVLIGKETYSREWVNWEIEAAHKQNKRIVGVYTRGSSETDIPENFEKYGHALVNWNTDSIIRALNGENNFTTPQGAPRPISSGGGKSINC